MKKLSLILFLSFLIGCNSEKEDKKNFVNNQNSVDSAELIVNEDFEENIPQNFTITNTTVEAYNLAIKYYSDKIIYDSLTYKKVNGIIKLPTAEKWKPFVIFKDTLVGTDNDEIKEFHYVGQFKSINHYVVAGSFWEHSECYLIGQFTGTQYTVWSCPEISPDGNFFG